MGNIYKQLSIEERVMVQRNWKEEKGTATVLSPYPVSRQSILMPDPNLFVGHPQGD